MFGLENQKKKKYEEFVFDLEKEMKIPAKNNLLRQKVEERMQKIRDKLRSGENPEEFQAFGILLHGYASLLKVMSRFTGKK